MSTLGSNGLKYKASVGSKLLLGMDEMDWLQYEHDEYSRRRNLAMLRRTGLVIPRNSLGWLQDHWKVAEDPVNAGYLVVGSAAIGQQMAVDDAGYAIVVEGLHRPYTATPPRTLALAVPNDGVWYTLVMRVAFDPYERGTVDFSSDVNLAGTDTDFQRYSGSAEGGAHGTYIRIDAADNAVLGAYNPTGLGAGIYELSSVTTPTTAVLTFAAPATVAGVPFTIAGSYASAPAVGLRDCHRRVVPEFELVAPRTRLPAAGDIVLADVRQSVGVVYVVDRRDNSLAYFVSDNSKVLYPIPVVSDSTGTLAFQGVVYEGAGPGTHRGLSVTTTSTRSLLLGYADTGGGVYCRSYDPATEALVAPVTIIAAGSGPHILRVPTAGGAFKHLTFYLVSKIVYMKVSTDDGATWSAATTVVDTSADPGGYYIAEIHDVILLRNQRVAVVCNYTTGAASSGESRVVVCDDACDNDTTYTWSTNATAGYAISAGANTMGAAVCQDPVTGNVWVFEQQFNSGDIDLTLRFDETLTDVGATTEIATYTAPAGFQVRQPTAIIDQTGQPVVWSMQVDDPATGGIFKMFRAVYDGGAVRFVDMTYSVAYSTIAVATSAKCRACIADDGAVYLAADYCYNLAGDNTDAIIYKMYCR